MTTDRGLASREPDGEPVDPRVARSRALIVTAATAHFLEQGYLAANLEDVAARAGVAKRTIYNLYGSKEALFRAILANALATAERFARDVVGSLGATDDVDTDLHEAGRRLARTVLDGRIVPMRRLLIGEVARFPDLARDYYERAPGRVMSALAEALDRLHDRRLLHVDDPQLAAEHFAFLVVGAPLDRALFDVEADAPAVDDVDARAAAGVDAFLRAYGRARARRGPGGARSG